MKQRKHTSFDGRKLIRPGSRIEIMYMLNNRYINNDLKELESKILSSKNRIHEIELLEYEVANGALNEPLFKSS